MIVERVGPMSVTKISKALYALIGLLVGGLASAVSVVGDAMGGSDMGMMGMFSAPRPSSSCRCSMGGWDS